MNRQWTPIEDLESFAALAKEELVALAEVWREQRDRLGSQEAYRQFEERLKREWAIETGLIERLYTLDRGITQLLIEHGIQTALIPRDSVTNRDLIVAMIADHKAAVEGLFDFVKGNRPLSTSYVKELHALITQHQETVEGIDSLGRRTSIPLLRGAYKKLPNNPLRQDGTVHEYCPPEQVDSEMDRLIALHHQHQNNGVPPEVEAAWLHHRFAQIHPFQDGNGRIARALATLVLVKAGWFPLVVRNQDRAKYIGALETADNGDLKPLVEYFSRLQREEFVRALNIVEDVRQERRVAEAIESVRLQLQRRRDSLVAEWETAKSIASALQREAEARLIDVAAELRREMQDVLEHGDYFASGAEDGGERSHYYRYQIVQTARALDYFANLRIYRAWTRLVLQNANRTEMLISFHGVGREFQGVLACSASWFQRVETEDGEREVEAVTPVTDQVFLINYKETLATASARFSGWLEDAIVRSLKLWQETAL